MLAVSLPTTTLLPIGSPAPNILAAASFIMNSVFLEFGRWSKKSRPLFIGISRVDRNFSSVSVNRVSNPLENSCAFPKGDKKADAIRSPGISVVIEKLCMDGFSSIFSFRTSRFSQMSRYIVIARTCSLSKPKSLL